MVKGVHISAPRNLLPYNTMLTKLLGPPPPKKKAPECKAREGIEH